MSYFKSAATKIAHNSTIPALGVNKDLKALQELILAEKAILQTLQKLSHDFSKSSECLRVWGTGEGEDLGDVLSASTTLFSYVATALTQFASHEQSVREYMKAVRTREENLDELRRRRKALGAKAEAAEKKLQKMSPEHKNLIQQTELLNTLREQIRNMDWEIITEEARLSDFKRTTTKNWMILKFGGLLECAEKATIVGELGRLLIDEIPLEATGPGLPRVAYTGSEKTANLLSEAERCVGEVVFDPQFVNEVSYVPMPQPSSSPVVRDSSNENANGNGAFATHSPHQSPRRISFPSPNLGAPNTQAQSYSHGSDNVLESNIKRMSGGGGYDEFGVSDGRDRVVGSMPAGPIRSSVDGYRSDSFSGPTASAARPRGNSSQFATFPARNSGYQGNAGPSYQLRDDPVVNASQENFASEVNKASQNDPRPPEDGRYSPAPTYETHWNPQTTTGLPKGAAPPQPNNRYSYMHSAPSGPRPVSQSQIVSTTQDVPTDVNADISREESEDDGSLLPYTKDELDVEDSSHRVRFGNEDFIPETGYTGERRQNEKGDFDPESLNAAAAREVSRELDALSFQPPIRPPMDDETPSPSQFPAPPSFGFPSAPPRLGTPIQESRNGRDMFSSSLPLRPPQPPFAQSSIQSSSPLVPPTIKQSSRSPSPAAGSIYETPPETSGGNPFPGRNFSSPISTPVGLPGTPRTISAAAFKRPQNRTASGPVSSMETSSSSSLPLSSQNQAADGISPLSIKKRPMPSTPYPPGRGPSIPEVPPLQPLNLSETLPPYNQQDEANKPMQSSQDLRGTSPTRPAVPNIVTSVNEQEENSSHDIISSYEHSGNGSPVQQDYGHLGHVRVVNAEEGGSGYSQGRFATNLDDSSSLR